MSEPAVVPDYDYLVARAFEGARLACNARPTELYSSYPARVRVLAGASLFRGQFMPAKRAARECAVGDQSRLSPSQIGQAGVTDGMISAVVEYLRSGAPVLVAPDPRQGGPAGSAERPALIAQAKRLYVDEGLSLEETGQRMNPPRSISVVSQMLDEAGVTRRSSGKPGVPRPRAPRPPAPSAAPCKPMAPRQKPKRSTVARFGSAEIEPEEAVDLRADHPALASAQSIFHGQVVAAGASPALLVSGHNNPKLGKEVLKGDRAGWPIFHLTLEERATCPRSCPVWAGCYGNAMPFARRHQADAPLIKGLRGAVAAKAKLYPGGFLVRLHTLGDFFSVEYVLMWAELLATTPALHVFGHTARREDDPDPESAKIAKAIAILTRAMWGRFAIRTSHAEFGPQRSVVVMEDPGLPDVIMCPAQTKATEACATCGLCWAQGARDKAIGFLKHGMKRGNRGRRPASPVDEFAEPTTDESPVAAILTPAPAAQEYSAQQLVSMGQIMDALERNAGLSRRVTLSFSQLASYAGVPAGSLGFLTKALVDRGLIAIERGIDRKPNTYLLPTPPTAGLLPKASAFPLPAAEPRVSPRGPVSRPSRQSRPCPPAPMPERRGAVRMKSVTSDMVRWSRAYIERGVSLDYLADCFDVDTEALGRALEPAA